MDQATGLTYMQQRYYDPQVGRFLSVDPMPMNPNNGSNFNRFGYAAENPYRFVDPDGRNACTEMFGAINCPSVPGNWNNTGAEGQGRNIQANANEGNVGIEAKFTSNGGNASVTINPDEAIRFAFKKWIDAQIGVDGTLSGSVVSPGGSVSIYFDNNGGVVGSATARLGPGFLSASAELGGRLKSLGYNIYGGSITASNFSRDGFTYKIRFSKTLDVPFIGVSVPLKIGIKSGYIEWNAMKIVNSMVPQLQGGISRRRYIESQNLEGNHVPP
jgi:RHS repeat-associated protein